ncbi:sodium:proton exchanger [Terrimonas sp.]|uniref:cation:proton antiporter domain-containing protein n=1 Tax=Terrimonas sp. TaxID=1914338 RepID=UPI000D523033|nr:cation:proton antiporter [Terrimonas sp.]PVD51863.1 sodium:proton exchanger [Terrimonas sp.]
MEKLTAENLLIIICSIVILSYFFSIISRYIRVPSVLLLLFGGVFFRWFSDLNNVYYNIPPKMVELLGVTGLIMIVLEAGLDLKLSRDKFKLIRDSFFSALVIFVISAGLITAILKYWLGENITHCLVYAIPLSIISSSIVIPSLHSLTPQKKEFSVYEASFSDIIGILAFNYFTAEEVMTGKSLLFFGGSIIISVILSLVLSFVLFIIMAKTKLNIKFFLIFSLLILIYTSGKILHLPSLIIIIIFGMLINNWEYIKVKWIQRSFPIKQVEPIRELLHSITAESSFLLRTFFFILFGYSIQLNFINQPDVWRVGGMIVAALFVVRLLYLRFFVHTNVFPEAFFIPRGLVTIVLFYKIPEKMKLTSFNEGILFFIILTTSVIMTIGMIFYKKKPAQILEESAFAERNDML